MTTTSHGTIRHSITAGGGRFSYLEACPAHGPLVLLMHGWPATALTWHPQIDALAAAGYHVIAPDMPGYGHSWIPEESSAYALRHLVKDLLSLLDARGHESAIWIGHDWGAAVAWALAAHHPRRCTAVAALVVPYRTLDRGWEAMLAGVNREVYPENRFPYAQFDYMAFYEAHFDATTALFDSSPDRLVRALYRPGNPHIITTRSPRSTVHADGGWFGGASVLPDLPRDTDILDDALYADLVESFTRNGFRGPNSYYLCHGDNRRYSDRSVHGGVLDMPALFIEARYDPTADTIRSALAEPMRDHCRRLREVSLPAGHWVGLERRNEVNTALLDWLPVVTGTAT